MRQQSVRDGGARNKPRRATEKERERERQTERDLYSMALWKGGRRCGEDAIGASERR